MVLSLRRAPQDTMTSYGYVLKSSQEIKDEGGGICGVMVLFFYQFSSNILSSSSLFPRCHLFACSGPALGMFLLMNPVCCHSW